MPKTKISEFSATAGNNTDIDGINIAEGCPPSGINDAIRELMAQLKDFQAGTAGDSFNGPVGTTTPAAGAFTNLSASGTFALTGDQVQISEGGTGQTTANAAFNALAPSQSTHAGKYLKTDGTNTSWDAIEINTADITGTLPVANGGTGVTSSTGTGSVVLSASPTFTGTVNGAALTLSSSLTLSGGTANGVAYLNGSKVLTTGGALTFDGSSALSVIAFGGTPYINFTSGGGTFLNVGQDSTGAFYNSAGSNNHRWLLSGGASEAMRLTSTGLGIGTSTPASKLDVVGAARLTADGASVSLYTGAGWRHTGSSGLYIDANFGGAANSVFIRNGSGLATQLTLDGSGNLGLGVTPSAFGGNYRGLQIGGNPVITGANAPDFCGNAYHDGTNYRYIGTNFAARYSVNQNNGGIHAWYTAASGTAGNTISFTQAMTLNSSGNLGIGTSSPSQKLDVVGNATVSGGITSSGGDITVGTAGKFLYSNYVAQNSGNSLYLRGAGASGQIEFQTNTTTKATLDSSGNLGLGVTPSAWGSNFKAIQGFSNSQFGLVASTNSVAIGTNYYHDNTNYIYTTTGQNAARYDMTSAGVHRWFTASSGTAGNAISFTQAMTLDANGNLLAGLTSPLYGTTNRVQMSANGSATAIMSVSHGGLASQSGYMFWDGANLQVANNSASGALIFGTNSATERARITSGGYSKFSNAGTYYGSTGTYHELRNSASDNVVFITNTAASSPFGMSIIYTAATPNGTANNFIDCTDSTALRVAMRSNGGISNYQANDTNLSDQRLKTDVQPAGTYLDKICAIPVKTFLYKDQTDTERNLGVMAQDVDAVAPELIDHSGFGEAPEGESPYLAVYQTDLQYALMKCIQELKAQNDDLRARVAQLEAK